MVLMLRLRVALCCETLLSKRQSDYFGNLKSGAFLFRVVEKMRRNGNGGGKSK
jgi:hypothetical protein